MLHNFTASMMPVKQHNKKMNIQNNTVKAIHGLTYVLTLGHLK